MTITKDEARALLDDYVMATKNGWVPSVECALREASPNLARAFIASEETREALEERVRVLEDALIWCSGSQDFGDGGIAREGWLKLCWPLIGGQS